MTGHRCKAEVSAGQSTGTVQNSIRELFEVKRADILAQSSFLQQEKLLYVDRYEHMYQQIMEKEQCLSLKELAVNGSDLIARGIQPGKEIGKILHQMLEKVLEEPELNEKEVLLAWYFKA